MLRLVKLLDRKTSIAFILKEDNILKSGELKHLNESDTF
jgi:hypothetical protein